MLVPILDARLNLGHESLECFNLVSRRRSVTNGAVREQTCEDDILDVWETEERGFREVKVGFKLQILAAESLDLIVPWL
jgi:hypothetical protein